jgi:hypothetical protein
MHGRLASTSPGDMDPLIHFQVPRAYCIKPLHFTSDHFFHYDYHISICGIEHRKYEIFLDIQYRKGNNYSFYCRQAWASGGDQQQSNTAHYLLTTVPSHLRECHTYVIVSPEVDGGRIKVLFVDKWSAEVTIKEVNLTWEQLMLDLDHYFHPPDDEYRKYNGYIPRDPVSLAERFKQLKAG